MFHENGWNRMHHTGKPMRRSVPHFSFCNQTMAVSKRHHFPNGVYAWCETSFCNLVGLPCRGTFTRTVMFTAPSSIHYPVFISLRIQYIIILILICFFFPGSILILALPGRDLLHIRSKCSDSFFFFPF